MELLKFLIKNLKEMKKITATSFESHGKSNLKYLPKQKSMT